MPDTSWTTPAPDTSFFGHPRGLATLFFTEMWERFSYYGLRSLLILFMVAPAASGGLGFDDPTAGVVYGVFTASAYLAALPGGWLADRILGGRKAVMIGGLFIAAGNFILCIPNTASFYSGLVCVVIGTGLLKANVSAIVGALYGRGDPRRDSGFSIFYMGINLGAFIAPLLCGWAAQRFGWRTGFLLAAVCMSFGTVQFLLGQTRLGEAGKLPATPNDTAAPRQFAIGAVILVAVMIAVATSATLGFITPKQIGDSVGLALIVVVVAFFSWLLFGAEWEPAERKRLIVVFFLFLSACVFWSVFEQAGSSMNLFAERATDNNVAGYQVPAPWYQSVQPMFIILLAPVFAGLWLRLGHRDPSSPVKFSLALLMAGLGFLLLGFGASFAVGGARVSPMWLVATYFLHTCGELLLSPVGLSAMTKLAPARVTGLMMGVYFLSISIGNYLGGRAAALYQSLPLPYLFGAVGAVAVVAGLIMASFTKPLNRLMGGVR